MFKLHSKFTPTGDQPQAIEKLVEGFKNGYDAQTLLGVTGSGKTFTMAIVIQKLNKPTIIMTHNKTLAGQLYSEFKEFFPENAVEYFISYYDYYQPEAYIASTDTYIEKDSSINDEIDKLRHSATAALFERKDVIIIASVSSIYSLGSPEDYSSMVLSVRPGMRKSREEVLKELISMQYIRNDIELLRGNFRVKGDVVDVFPASSSDEIIRLEFFGDEIDRYTMDQAVADGLTVSIKYHPRIAKVLLDKNKVKEIEDYYKKCADDGATFEDVVLLKQNVLPSVKVKAAGGIRTFADAQKFLELGASRLGTSTLIKQMEREREK